MTNTKQIEVELRGPLTSDEADALAIYCRTNGRVIGEENRFLVDYSTFIEGIEDRMLDVRVRITNGRVEIVTKQGLFSGPSRIEAIARLEGSDAVPAFQMMGMLGYRRGVACDRGIRRYEVDGMEIAIQDVRCYGNPSQIHSRFFEAEILCHEGEEKQAEQRIRAFLQKLGLRVFEAEEWSAYVHTMNTEANGIFDLDANGLADLAALRSGSPSENNDSSF